MREALAGVWLWCASTARGLESRENVRERMRERLNDMAVGIMSWLPPESLKRFKLVISITSIDEDDYDENDLYKAEVFTLSTKNVDNLYFPRSKYQVVYCHGVCYWYFWHEACIVSFDVSEEVFQIIPFPENALDAEEEWESLNERTNIVVWNDRLVLFFYPELDPMVIDMLCGLWMPLLVVFVALVLGLNI
ncbi:uncharacterized protein LOC133791516 [Humulus lupulus]|uniref:uncharacterized protein LOC133791516 n=1 Tax=Humulus lupulus TaxID=3486 RepID=UPI002B40AD2C|nr:uncharacterized protein LOC133791516 [Humulus lupulus]